MEVVVPPEDDDVGLVHGLESLNRTARPSEYPSNITDWFKGRVFPRSEAIECRFCLETDTILHFASRFLETDLSTHRSSEEVAYA